MNWHNLKNNKCSKCDNWLNQTFWDSFIHCINEACDFKISPDRFDDMVNTLYRAKEPWKTEEQNLEELNNLGHGLITDDFSDSPHLK